MPRLSLRAMEDLQAEILGTDWRDDIPDGTLKKELLKALEAAGRCTGAVSQVLLSTSVRALFKESRLPLEKGGVRGWLRGRTRATMRALPAHLQCRVLSPIIAQRAIWTWTRFLLADCFFPPTIGSLAGPIGQFFALVPRHMPF